MNLQEKKAISRKVLQALIFKKKFPLVISWDLTYRCNLQCTYCSFWEKKTGELDTKVILHRIEELIAAGTKFIKFSGGEPLLRDDLGDIIEFCRRRKIYVGLDSNGTLVKRQLKKIQRANEIKFSFDGPRDVHDAIRGNGVYDKVIEAVELCKRKKIKVGLRTVISKWNISQIDHVLQIAKDYEIGVDFQPADRITSGNPDKEIFLIPDESEYKKVIAFLIQKKLKGHPCINSSLSALRHLYFWPNRKEIYCFARLSHCYIQPDGRISLCPNHPSSSLCSISINHSFKEAFNSLSLSSRCDRCWCSSMVDFNLLGGLKLDAILTLWKKFSDSKNGSESHL